MSTGDLHTKFCGSVQQFQRYAHGQTHTHRQTDKLIAILRCCSGVE